MAYREGRDPYEVAAEIWVEAQRREVVAAAERTNAESEAALKKSGLEMSRARLGALTALGRHLDALAATDARTRDFTDEERVVIRDIEERRAAFLRERGITEGPSLLSDERPDTAELARQIESTRAESEAVREALVRAEQELAQAEQLREQARRKLEAATKERLAAEKELERLRSVG